MCAFIRMLYVNLHSLMHVQTLEMYAARTSTNTGSLLQTKLSIRMQTVTPPLPDQLLINHAHVPVLPPSPHALTNPNMRNYQKQRTKNRNRCHPHRPHQCVFFGFRAWSSGPSTRTPKPSRVRVQSTGCRSGGSSLEAWVPPHPLTLSPNRRRTSGPCDFTSV